MEDWWNGYTWYEEKYLPELKDGYTLQVYDYFSQSSNQYCGGGAYSKYRILDKNGDIVCSGETCRCRRGCGGRDCIADDWGCHDTDIERYRK